MTYPWVLPASCSGTVVTVLVDLADAQRIGGRRLSIGSHGYPQLCVPAGRVTLLHRWLLDLKRGDGLIGDHVDGNRLNNRRGNLRIVHPSGSSQNVSGRGRSPHRGVYPMRARWQARVKFRGEVYYLGTFATQEEAAIVAAAKRQELMPFYVPPSERAA